MIDRLQIKYEGGKQVYLTCSHCQSKLADLLEVASYVQTHQYLEQGYEGQFLVIPQSSNNQSHTITYDLIDLKIEVEQPFILMQTTPCFCFQCQLKIGIYIHSASEMNREWLSKSILVEVGLVKWNPRKQKSILYELIEKLRNNQQKRGEEEEEEQNEGQGQGQKQRKRKSISFDFDETIRDSLEKIVFFSQALNQLEEAIEDVEAKKRFKKAKMVFQIKSNKK